MFDSTPTFTCYAAHVSRNTHTSLQQDHITNDQVLRDHACRLSIANADAVRSDQGAEA